jgi:hypothetical protein
MCIHGSLNAVEKDPHEHKCQDQSLTVREVCIRVDIRRRHHQQAGRLEQPIRNPRGHILRGCVIWPYEFVENVEAHLSSHKQGQA